MMVKLACEAAPNHAGGCNAAPLPQRMPPLISPCEMLASTILPTAPLPLAFRLDALIGAAGIGEVDIVKRSGILRRD